MNRQDDTNSTGRIGLWGMVAIGVGGMVGGGIFAVLGLAVQLAQGGHRWRSRLVEWSLV